MAYYEIFDNTETTLTSAFVAGTDTTFFVDSSTLPALLYSTSSIDVIFSISNGTDTCFVSAYNIDEFSGVAEFAVQDQRNPGGFPSSATFPIGSPVSLSTSRAAILAAHMIPVPSVHVEPGSFGDAWIVTCTGSYGSALVDQSSESAHADIIITNLVQPDNIIEPPRTRNQSVLAANIPPRTFDLFVRQHLSGGNYDGTISVNTPTGPVVLTPTGTGPTTTADTKCLHLSTNGIPASIAFIVAEWRDVQAVSLEESEG